MPAKRGRRPGGDHHGADGVGAGQPGDAVAGGGVLGPQRQLDPAPAVDEAERHRRLGGGRPGPKPALDLLGGLVGVEPGDVELGGAPNPGSNASLTISQPVASMPRTYRGGVDENCATAR